MGIVSRGSNSGGGGSGPVNASHGESLSEDHNTKKTERRRSPWEIEGIIGKESKDKGKGKSRGSEIGIRVPKSRLSS